ncbi:hypothetical protein AB4K20DRAFT_1925338 [Rhizopus microsporus]
MIITTAIGENACPLYSPRPTEWSNGTKSDVLCFSNRFAYHNWSIDQRISQQGRIYAVIFFLFKIAKFKTHRNNKRNTVTIVII